MRKIILILVVGLVGCTRPADRRTVNRDEPVVELGTIEGLRESYDADPTGFAIRYTKRQLAVSIRLDKIDVDSRGKLTLTQKEGRTVYYRVLNVEAAGRRVEVGDTIRVHARFLHASGRGIALTDGTVTTD